MADAVKAPAMRDVALEVELQSELHLARSLSVGDHSHRVRSRSTAVVSCSASAACARCVEVWMVKNIQEVCPELESHRLRNREILLQADIGVEISRADDWPLRGTVPEPGGWLTKGAGIKPYLAYSLNAILWVGHG